MFQWLKHAFAVESQEVAEPTEEQKPVIEFVCGQIVKRNLTTPSLVTLEMCRPLNFIGAQMMHVFAPFLAMLTDRKGHEHFASFLEQRGSIEYICSVIERMEAESDSDTGKENE